MIFESVEKMFKIKSILAINCLILLDIVKNILSGTIRTEYNFGNQQNPEIDKSFNHVLGSNVYFVTEAPEKSMYITAIYPSLTLEVKLKIYTDNSQIINAFNNGRQIFFGFDLLIDNIDKEEPNSLDYNKYKTDIMICIFSKIDVECHDYVKKGDEYLLNDGGVILLNNLIPLGFKNVDLNFIQENVIGFKSYFSVKFEKEYPPLFDNITMFNWINYVAADTGEGVIGFYGILDSSINSINDTANSKNIPLYSKMLDFVDGSGLEEDNLVFLKIKSFFLILIIFLIIL